MSNTITATALEQVIIKRINDHGPIRFHDFMEMALYYPGMGYYRSAACRIGAAGDFYTSPCLDNVFGVMLATQLEQMWRLLDRPDFTIVEQGAGTGLLCRDILTYLKSFQPLFYDALTYYILEISEAMVQKEKELLCGSTDKVYWISSLADAGKFTGCLFSNELVDNFPVYRVRMQHQELMEVYVGYNSDRCELVEHVMPAPGVLKNYLRDCSIELAPGTTTEINLQAESWIAAVATQLEKGFVMTIDYGYSAAELYHAARKEGTLRCFHRHRVNNEPLYRVGEQDITSHVNFTSLATAGKRAGLGGACFTTQANFIRGIGLTNYIRQLEEAKATTGSSQGMSVLLNGLGANIKVLLQGKGCNPATLSGARLSIPL